MNNKARYISLAMIFLSLIYLSSCVDFPSGFEGPVFDTELNLPVTNRSYSLEELLDKDSSLTSRESDNVLVYSSSQDIDAVMVNDNAKLDDFSSDISSEIGEIKIDDVQPDSTEVLVGAFWDYDTISGLFPRQTINPQLNFPPVNAFEEATLKTGILRVVFKNTLPLVTYMEEFALFNTGNPTAVFDTSFGFREAGFQIPADSEVSVDFNLAGVTMSSDLSYDATFYSPGSATPVDVTNDEGTVVVYNFVNNTLVIESALAEIPEQDDIVTANNFRLGDEDGLGRTDKISEAEFKSGSMTMFITNHFNVDLNLDITIKNLINPATGVAYHRNLNLNANQTGEGLGSIADLNGWKIISLTPGTPTDSIEYEIVAKVGETSSPVRITEGDSIAVDLDFTNVVMRSASGQLKPFDFTMDATEFDLDYGDLNDKFTYNGANFNSPVVNLNLENSAGFGFLLNGKLVGENKGGDTSYVDLTNIQINSDGTSIVPLDDEFKSLLSSFSGTLPDNFRLNGTITVNNDYNDGSVYDTDSISGTVAFDMPLDVGFSGGQIIDTVELDFGDVDTAELDNVNEGTIFMELVNGTGADIKFFGEVLDVNGNFIINLPPNPVNDGSGNMNDTLTVPAATVDGNGNVTAPTTVTRQMNATGDQISDIIDGENIRVIIKMVTAGAAGSNPNPIKFKTTDEFRFRVWAKANLRIDLTEDDEE